VIDVITALEKDGILISVVDPRTNIEDASRAFGIDLVEMLNEGSFQAIVITVAHDEFRALGCKRLRTVCCDNSIIYDLKHILPRCESDLRL
jgi:UDP-N-acetyl-D-galactosamine dehydrogenase